MNSQHRFPKPQRPEHLPEQAGAFPKPCPSQPISRRRSVPRLYSGKCSLSLRLPVLSRTTGPGARQCHRASLLCGSEKGSLLYFQRSPGWPPRPGEGQPSSLLPPGHAGHWKASVMRHSYLWVGECAENSRPEGRERAESSARPGQASKEAFSCPAQADSDVATAASSSPGDPVT